MGLFWTRFAAVVAVFAGVLAFVGVFVQIRSRSDVVTTRSARGGLEIESVETSLPPATAGAEVAASRVPSSEVTPAAPATAAVGSPDESKTSPTDTPGGGAPSTTLTETRTDASVSSAADVGTEVTTTVLTPLSTSTTMETRTTQSTTTTTAGAEPATSATTTEAVSASTTVSGDASTDDDNQVGRETDDARANVPAANVAPTATTAVSATSTNGEQPVADSTDAKPDAPQVAPRSMVNEEIAAVFSSPDDTETAILMSQGATRHIPTAYVFPLTSLEDLDGGPPGATYCPGWQTWARERGGYPAESYAELTLTGSSADAVGIAAIEIETVTSEPQSGITVLCRGSSGGASFAESGIDLHFQSGQSQISTNCEHALTNEEPLLRTEDGRFPIRHSLTEGEFLRLLLRSLASGSDVTWTVSFDTGANGDVTLAQEFVTYAQPRGPIYFWQDGAYVEDDSGLTLDEHRQWLIDEFNTCFEDG